MLDHMTIGTIVAFRPATGYAWRSSQLGEVVAIDGDRVTISIPVIDWRGQWQTRDYAASALAVATEKQAALFRERRAKAMRGESFGLKGRLRSGTLKGTTW